MTNEQLARRVLEVAAKICREADVFVLANECDDGLRTLYNAANEILNLDLSSILEEARQNEARSNFDTPENDKRVLDFKTGLLVGAELAKEMAEQPISGAVDEQAERAAFERRFASAPSEQRRIDTGCDLHRNFRSSGPFCPVCLMEASEQDKMDAERYRAFIDAMVADYNGQDLTNRQRAIKESFNDAYDDGNFTREEVSRRIDAAIAAQEKTK